MILIRMDCAYPGTELEPTTVVFSPVGLGWDALGVHEAFRRLLVEREYFEVESAYDGRLPFHAETVRRVLTWSV